MTVDRDTFSTMTGAEATKVIEGLSSADEVIALVQEEKGNKARVSVLKAADESPSITFVASAPVIVENVSRSTVITDSYLPGLRLCRLWLQWMMLQQFRRELKWRLVHREPSYQ